MSYIIGNWKMNGTHQEARDLASGLLHYSSQETSSLPEIIICPPAPYLLPLHSLFSSSSLKLGGQDCSSEEKGSFTGDVSALQLVDSGCTYVIIGHSERRHYHKESSSLIQKKIKAALTAGLKPIICIGEDIENCTQDHVFSLLSDQLNTDLPSTGLRSENFLIAYEPVWAIGTGITPHPQRIEQVGRFIKKTLTQKLGEETDIPVLYGGSANSLNAASFLTLSSLDGLLVGSASLKLQEFISIIQTATPAY